ncbi:hypothetical protein CBM2626_A190002 [Cupriavidus taiwanensis]|nr:hypothetical protein CBM2626_A190002 [Cupriavidus taiwanensis]
MFFLAASYRSAGGQRQWQELLFGRYEALG